MSIFTIKPGPAMLAGFFLCVACGCESDTGRNSPSTRQESSPKQRRIDPVTPTEVIERVREHRIGGELALLEQYIEESQREAVVDLIYSVDELISANDTLVEAALEHLGPGTAEAVDRPGVRNIVGVFSHDVKVISERIIDDRAEVVVQIADRVPLQTVDMVLTKGKWLIKTDPPIAGMAEELRRLADVLGEITRGVRSGKYDSGTLAKELRAREVVIGRRLSEIVDSAESE